MTALRPLAYLRTLLREKKVRYAKRGTLTESPSLCFVPTGTEGTYPGTLTGPPAGASALVFIPEGPLRLLRYYARHRSGTCRALDLAFSGTRPGPRGRPEPGPIR